MLRALRMIAVIGCLPIVFLVPSAAGQTFQGLGHLPGREVLSSANGMTSDGLLLVGYAESATESEAWMWRASTGLLGLGDLPGGAFRGWADGIARDGTAIVGTSESDLGLEVFRWTPGGGMVGLGRLPGDVASGGNASSLGGQFIVGYSQSDSGGTHAFRWSQATGMVGLGFLPGGASSEAFVVSDDGSIVMGRSESSTGTHAFRWTQAGGMTDLGALASIGPAVMCALSSDGTTGFGGSASGTGGADFQAVRWTEATGLVGLGDLPGGVVDSIIATTSADGLIAGGQGNSDLGPEAILWDEAHGVRNLREVLVGLGLGPQLDGWILTEARAMSADGLTIAGVGINPDGITEAWIATIPAPGSTLALIAGSCFMGVRRRHVQSEPGATD